MTPQKFRALVWRFYRAHGRHDLPWRRGFSVYRVLVSEIMLQQTQVERVIPFYNRFIKTYPTAKQLAKAPLSDVLSAWQGLGYNRRAKMLHAAAKILATKQVKTIAGLEALPGVGPYTARAAAAFSLNEDCIVVETNIRTAVIHHFFPDSQSKSIHDEKISEILIATTPKGHAREWYSALMDYGAHLKRSGISHNARSTTHVKQKAFEGSMRQARGAILRELTKGKTTKKRLENSVGTGRETQATQALAALMAEGFVKKEGRRYALAD